MNKQQLRVIETAVNSTDELFPLNQTWARLYDEYNIGRTQGNKLKLSRSDKKELVALVKIKTGFDLDQLTVKDISGLHREDVLSIAIDEKLLSRSAKKNRLAIKPLPGSRLKINHQEYQLPAEGYLDIASEHLSDSAHTSVLVIENFRCFDALNKMKLNLGRRYNDPLVLYRGDNVYSEKTVRLMVAQLELPVLVMSDIDPRGLTIAQSFPSAEGLVAPGLSALANLLGDSDKANPQLYSKQLAGCQHALSTSSHSLILNLWETMKQHQSGIVQEYWINEEIELLVHRFDLKP